jgi:hypothetical protein
MTRPVPTRGSSTSTVSTHDIILIPNPLGRTCGRQRHADAGGPRLWIAHRLAGCPPPYQPVPARSSRWHAGPWSGRCAAAEYGRPRPGSVMPPARSAVDRRGHPGEVRRASCPPCSPAPPIGTWGGCGLRPDEDERWSLRSGSVFCPPATPRRGASTPPAPFQGERGVGPRCCGVRAPPGRPARWRVGSRPRHRPSRHPAHAGAGIVPARPSPGRRHFDL